MLEYVAYVAGAYAVAGLLNIFIGLRKGASSDWRSDVFFKGEAHALLGQFDLFITWPWNFAKVLRRMAVMLGYCVMAVFALLSVLKNPPELSEPGQ